MSEACDAIHDSWYSNYTQGAKVAASYGWQTPSASLVFPGDAPSSFRPKVRRVVA